MNGLNSLSRLSLLLPPCNKFCINNDINLIVSDPSAEIFDIPEFSQRVINQQGCCVENSSRLHFLAFFNNFFAALSKSLI